MISELMTTPQVAKRLNMSHVQLNTLLHNGELGELPTNRVAAIRVWTPADFKLIRQRVLEFCRRNKKFYAVALKIAQTYEAVLMRGGDHLVSMKEIANVLEIKPSQVREWQNLRSEKILGSRLRPVAKDGRLSLFTWKSVYDWSSKVVEWLDQQYVPLGIEITEAPQPTPQPEVATPEAKEPEAAPVIETKPVEKSVVETPIPVAPAKTAADTMSGLSGWQWRKAKYGI
jgi:hypothetical protein